jgi:tetratricopeptide (TPR) repeat protein
LYLCVFHFNILLNISHLTLPTIKTSHGSKKQMALKQLQMRKLILTLFFILISTLTTLGQDNYLAKGNEYLNTEEFDKAEQIFREAIKSNPVNLIYQCQLGLTLIEQKKYKDAEKVLETVLNTDSNTVAAIWYSGIGNFYNAQDRAAIKRFEKALTLLDEKSGQYYSANWFIGTCYANLLKSTGITYSETNRMFSSYEEYLRLQPNAQDAGKIRAFVERKKKRRPSDNVEKWIDL